MLAALALLGAVLPPWEEMRNRRVVGEHYTEHLPGGLVVRTTFKGWISEGQELPLNGNELGDEIQVINSGTCWIWMVSPGGALGWVDP
jgi:hypothetical protein